MGIAEGPNFYRSVVVRQPYLLVQTVFQ